MNGVHDMGGMQDFGPVVPEPDEPIFHADWERRVLALTLSTSAPGGRNIDMSRHCLLHSSHAAAHLPCVEPGCLRISNKFNTC